MKTVITTTSAGRRLGLITSIITLLGGFAAAGAPTLIVNETFDPPTITLGGWNDGTTLNIQRQYVNDGVGGSMAVQLSAELINGGAYVAVMVYQNGEIVGNDLATTQNTVLTFDLKVDRPDLQNITVGLQSMSGFEWNAYFPSLLGTASRGTVRLGSYVPGTFKTISVALDDPLWIEEPYSGPLAGPFDPSGKTYQIWFQVDSGGLPTLGQFAVTIDNIRISSKTPMVPWKAASTGNVTYSFDTSGHLISVAVAEGGVVTHLGNYSETATLSPQPLWGGIATGYVGPVEITAANGDKLFGSLFDLPTRIGVIIENGTGRFQGARGSYLGTLTWITDTSFTATATGRISIVGSIQ